MVRLILFYPAFFIILIASAQGNAPKGKDAGFAQADSMRYFKETTEFIKFIRDAGNVQELHLLVDKPYLLTSFNCLADFRKDSTTLTSDERQEVENQISKPLLKNWNGELVPGVRMINGDTVNSIFKDRSKGWGYFSKNIGCHFNTFSAPVFLRNYTYCLFYSDHHCCGRCGSGQWVLYKKEDNKWIKVKFYCGWIG